ncbi:putative membrane protein [Rhizobium aquaticum]|uniref:Membrane protein n=1 Tax=Rhizobium aquaticum TaxID=1549636 RepID=A0ABV2J3G3_9HYPH
MSEIQPNTPDASGFLEPGKGNVQLVYVLYLAGFVVGITPLVGLIFAYINRGKIGGIYDSHYTYAIRTFWIGVLYSLISIVLTFLVIGVVGFFATAIWSIVRCVIGLQKVSRGEAIENPQSWLI